MLPPMVIYKRKGIYRGWTSTFDDAEALIAHNDKGFNLSRKALHWSGYIAVILGLAYVLWAYPSFYSWMATAPATPFGLYAMQ